MSRSDYHRQGAVQNRTDGTRLAEIDRELAAAFDRCGELEARAAALKAKGPA